MESSVSAEKAQAKGWREWLSQEFEWDILMVSFGMIKIRKQVAVRLERWVGLLRMQGGSQNL